jgi:hypothetical protein
MYYEQEVPLTCSELAFYVLPKYSDPPDSCIISDHCRKKALTELATLACELHIGKTKDSLIGELLAINDLYCNNPLSEKEVCEIAEEVYERVRSYC